jgi:hypothetical protein
MTVTSIISLAINANSVYSFQHEDVTDFKLTSNDKVAGYLSIDDRYYSDSRLLCIRDRVDYVAGVAKTPYNLAVTVAYYIHYVGEGSVEYMDPPGEFEGTAYKDGYILSKVYQAKQPRTVHLVIIDHYINYENNVSNYTNVSLHTQFEVS